MISNINITIQFSAQLLGEKPSLALENIIIM